MDELKIHILGCGSATPSLRHLPSCQAVQHRRRLMLIDCGEGAQLQLQRQGLNFNLITDIFISHLHGDHCLGLPGLLSTLSLHQKGGTITIHTFKDGAEIISNIVNFFCREKTYDLKFNILDPEKPGVALDTKSFTVEYFPLRHRVPCVGFLFREKPKPRHLRGDLANFYNIPIYMRQAIKDGADFQREDGTTVPNCVLTTAPSHAASYAYCSDTVYTPSLADYVQGVDLLYHEATYADDCTHKAHARFHSTASEAARIAEAANVKQLMIGHYSKSYPDESLHLAEARAIFPNTIAAQEGLTVAPR